MASSSRSPVASDSDVAAPRSGTPAVGATAAPAVPAARDSDESPTASVPTPTSQLSPKGAVLPTSSPPDATPRTTTTRRSTRRSSYPGTVPRDLSNSPSPDPSSRSASPPNPPSPNRSRKPPRRWSEAGTAKSKSGTGSPPSPCRGSGRPDPAWKVARRNASYQKVRYQAFLSENLED